MPPSLPALIRDLETYVTDPAADREARQRMASEFLGPRDGKGAERTADAVASFLRSRPSPARQHA